MNANTIFLSCELLKSLNIYNFAIVAFDEVLDYYYFLNGRTTYDKRLVLYMKRSNFSTEIDIFNWKRFSNNYMSNNESMR